MSLVFSILSLLANCIYFLLILEIFLMVVSPLPFALLFFMALSVHFLLGHVFIFRNLSKYSLISWISSVLFLVSDVFLYYYCGFSVTHPLQFIDVKLNFLFLAIYSIFSSQLVNRNAHNMFVYFAYIHNIYLPDM